VRRLAVLSLHSSPLLQPGSGDAGGMNVYVRELVASLAQAGVESTVYVRRWRDDLPPVVTVEPGFRVVHVPAGASELAKEELLSTVDEFTDRVIDDLRTNGDVDALHANYWLSGIAAHRIKHTLDLPLVSVFHTLARVKAETGDPEPQRRIDAEAEVIRCTDVIIANSRAEADQLEHYYHAEPSRVEVVPPGVDHAFFSPGNKVGARKALGLGREPVLLFVGRIQPLKGASVAIEAVARSRHRDAKLLIVGGASGTEGSEEVRRVHALVDDLDLRERVVFVPPQPHHVLSTYYRAADAVLVPSRSESFGLVALEAAACGTPVVAAAVGGLLTLVDDGRTGYLIDSREPSRYTAAIDRILGDDELSQSLSTASVRAASSYTWATTAARLRRIYADLVTRAPLRCDR
jgi:D-inositol-3-phosphate glycosyltransferase